MYFRQIQKQLMSFLRNTFLQRFYTLLLLCFSASALFAQKNQALIPRVDPPNWWVNMNYNRVELLFHGENIQQWELSLEAEGTRITGITPMQNKNYLIAEIEISPEQQPEDIRFIFSQKKKKSEVLFPILERGESYPRGIDANDLMYLIFPDRFANGDPSNDALPGMLQSSADRNDGYARHGGDIQGIIDHLDYLDELGIKSLWINPLVENNQPSESYHGYAVTDNYKIDPRFGSNELYRELNRKCHQRGIQVVADIVYNHWGSEHYLYKEMPDSNWFHLYPTYTKTTYRAEVLLDPYASQYDKHLMSNGWFDRHMPDLNQYDEHLTRYLIQNSLWWIEYAGIDAFRIDTYAYPAQKFMKYLSEAIYTEYPDFTMFGETWVQGSPVQAFFSGGSELNPFLASSHHSVTDFQLYYAITKGFTEPFGWEEGFRRIQMTLSHDILYSNPNELVTFLDNHDLSRFYSMVGEDFALYKMGIAMLYTLRGIPCIYYGTEILMKNYCDPDTKVREDFPGGWKGDAQNKFTAAGRSAQENEAFNYLKTLGQWRKANPWLGKSKLTQFVPENNTYVYFRHDEGHTLMCVYNGNDEEVKLPLARFAECIQNKPSGLDIIQRQRMTIGEEMLLPAKSVQLIQLF